jgi:pilus assembly protein CpaF
MSTGHRRCLATLHANSSLEGLDRLDVLTLSATSGWAITDVRSLVNSAVGLVIHMQRDDKGRRTISEIASIEPSTGTRRIIASFTP